MRCVHQPPHFELRECYRSEGKSVRARVDGGYHGIKVFYTKQGYFTY